MNTTKLFLSLSLGVLGATACSSCSGDGNNGDAGTDADTDDGRTRAFQARVLRFEFCDIGRVK